MSAESLESEVERLRAEVESYRQRELAELRAALASARDEAAHYRAEAQRNAETGRVIAAGYQATIAELRAKIETARVGDVSARRFGQPARN